MLQQHTTNLPYSWDVGGGLEWLIVWKFQQNKKVSVYGFLKNSATRYSCSTLPTLHSHPPFSKGSTFRWNDPLEDRERHMMVLRHFHSWHFTQGHYPHLGVKKYAKLILLNLTFFGDRSNAAMWEM